MERLVKVAIMLVAVIALGTAWMTRLSVTNPSTREYIYVTDRWTGTVSMCNGFNQERCTRVFGP